MRGTGLTCTQCKKTLYENNRNNYILPENLASKLKYNFKHCKLLEAMKLYAYIKKVSLKLAK